MTRHLQNIPTPIEQIHTTLRQLAGERDSVTEIDHLLRRKLGDTAYYLRAMNLYGFNDADYLADPIVDAGGGVLARYGGLCEVSIERRNNTNRHLGAVAVERRTLACFSVVDTNEVGVIDAQCDVSLGAIMENVGVELDEEVIIQLPGADNVSQSSPDGERPVLRIVK